MKHLFIPCELAVIAKEKGFDEPCLMFWSIGLNDFKQLLSTEMYKQVGLSAPLYQQIVDWLFTKGIHIDVFPITKTDFAYSIILVSTLPHAYDSEDYNGNTNTKQIMDEIIEEEKRGIETPTIEVQAKWKATKPMAYNTAIEEAFKHI